jgi:hypothetical protein
MSMHYQQRRGRSMRTVKHRYVSLGGIDVFNREAGQQGAQ